jgi:acetate kinase
VNVLVLNAGSSTLKFRLFRMGGAVDSGEELLASGIVEKWGTPGASLRLDVAGQPREQRSVAAETPAHAAEHAVEACLPLGVDALGHRVVHGGWKYREPTRITPEVVSGIREVSVLAPLHNEMAIDGIEAGLRLLPQTPAVAVFDTAFHQTLPEVAYRYAIPIELSDRNQLRRYGFHGISHRFVSGRLLECLKKPAEGSRLITCHLGNGASICAIRYGQSVDTSMGLTPLEGLVMGTRSGDVDPGLVLHLINQLKMPGREVDDLLNRHSGMLGISGTSGDSRDLERAAAEGDARATLALDMFAYRIRKYLGAYAAVLGGVDAIAFSGGIGEHSATMRRRVCRDMDFFGIALDDDRNSKATADDATPINDPASPVGVWVVPTDEERQIAREMLPLLG